ncbi:MAG TPA: PH domain-containing protein [Trebonia sp.]|jgi:uncharacterized membrane protein YdbT with pleckstrin-like domain|nr:PH domain-containing protein [Trebonia sp.]
MSRDQTLAPGENPVAIVHPHWKVLVAPIVQAVLIVAIVLVAVVLIPWGKAAPIGPLVLLAVALVGLMGRLMLPLLRWRTTTYELTDRRLRMREGIVSRFGKDIPLSRITDVSFETSLWDRMLGSGTLVVESPGEHGQVRLTEIPRVERLQSTIFQLVEEERARAAQPEADGPG